jgi:hypothetical protein
MFSHQQEHNQNKDQNNNYQCNHPSLMSDQTTNEPKTHSLFSPKKKRKRRHKSKTANPHDSFLSSPPLMSDENTNSYRIRRNSESNLDVVEQVRETNFEPNSFGDFKGRGSTSIHIASKTDLNTRYTSSLAAMLLSLDSPTIKRKPRKRRKTRKEVNQSTPFEELIPNNSQRAPADPIVDTPTETVKMESLSHPVTEKPVSSPELEAGDGQEIVTENDEQNESPDTLHDDESDQNKLHLEKSRSNSVIDFEDIQVSTSTPPPTKPRRKEIPKRPSPKKPKARVVSAEKIIDSSCEEWGDTELDEAEWEGIESQSVSNNEAENSEDEQESEQPKQRNSAAKSKVASRTNGSRSPSELSTQSTGKAYRDLQFTPKQDALLRKIVDDYIEVLCTLADLTFRNVGYLSRHLKSFWRKQIEGPFWPLGNDCSLIRNGKDDEIFHWFVE